MRVSMIDSKFSGLKFAVLYVTGNPVGVFLGEVLSGRNETKMEFRYGFSPMDSQFFAVKYVKLLSRESSRVFSWERYRVCKSA